MEHIEMRQFTFTVRYQKNLNKFHSHVLLKKHRFFISR